MKTVIVFRFSAMGDVALTLAALTTVLAHRPDLKIIVVTRPRFRAFFAHQPQIQVFPCRFESIHKGLPGLFRLFKDLRHFQPDAVLDLHQNLRTRMLKVFFKMAGKKTFSLNKYRAKKKEIISGLRHTPIKHISEQYLDVFKEAGIIPKHLHIQKQTPLFRTSEETQNTIDRWLQKEQAAHFIGIAPFAQHIGKIWPLEKYEQLIESLQTKNPDRKILLFGGGAKETEILNTLAEKHLQLRNVAGVFTLEEELELISRASFFICGDTSNMHFAAMMGVKVISIWGATHTLTGFGPLFQPDAHKVEISRDELTCRPCSVYGKTPCRRGDYACLNWITPEQVLQKLENRAE